MATIARPSILCTKCQSTVPWAAHCPHCWAYLEFAGDPPWRPDGEAADEAADEAESETDAQEPEPSTSDTTSQANESGEQVAGQGATEGLEAVATDQPSPSAPRTADDDARPSSVPEPVPTGVRAINLRQWIAGAVVTILAIALMIPLTRQAGWWFPVFLGPPLLAALLAAAYLAFLDAPAGTVTAPNEEIEADTVPDEDEEFDPSAYTPQELQARRAMINQKVVERTTTGDAICDSCQRPNPSTVHFCDWCGTPMSGVQLAPKTQVILEAAESNPKKKKRKRGPTRNWRSTGPAILIVFAVIGALAFAFFGPGAFQSRLSITRVIQSVSQWVNPMVGRAAKVTQVTATSSLPGTTPESLDTIDASTFWASAISSTMGANSELTFTFDVATEIDRMVILPGIQNKIFGRSAVAYPRIVALTFDDGSQVEQSLAAIQSDEDLKQLVRFPARTTKSVKLKINAVYLPVGYQTGDYGTVAISAVEFMEPPQPPTVFGVQNQGLRTPGIPGVPSTS